MKYLSKGDAPQDKGFAQMRKVNLVSNV